MQIVKNCWYGDDFPRASQFQSTSFVAIWHASRSLRGQRAAWSTLWRGSSLEVSAHPRACPDARMTHLNSHAEPPKFALIDFSTHSNLRLSLHTTLETGSFGAQSYRPTSRQRIRNRNLGDRSATRSAAQRARNRDNAHLLGHGVRAHAQIYPA